MIDVKALIQKQLSETVLDILVFGPTISPLSSDPYIASLQKKRIEIKRKLVEEGHRALFGEDVIDPSLPAHLADPLLQEIVAMRAADLIIVLVGSPGAIAEASTIARDRELCGKTGFFCYEDHKDGLVAQHLQYLVNFGATCQLVTLKEVEVCHLTTAVLERVVKVQTGKAFLF